MTKPFFLGVLWDKDSVHTFCWSFVDVWFVTTLGSFLRCCVSRRFALLHFGSDTLGPVVCPLSLSLVTGLMEGLIVSYLDTW